MFILVLRNIWKPQGKFMPASRKAAKRDICARSMREEFVHVDQWFTTYFTGVHHMT